MRFTHGLVLAVLAMAVGTGCGNTRWLFSADFEGQSGSPHGSVPGQPPSDDFINVGNGSSNWPKISSGRLLFPVSTSASQSSHLTQLRSAKAKKSDSKRTISWTGQIASLDSSPPLSLNIGGWEKNTPGPDFPLRLKLFGAHAELLDHNGNPLENPGPLPPDNSGSWTHTGTIILRLNTGSYTVIIKHSKPSSVDPSFIEWKGTLPTATLNELRDNPRMIIKMYYPGPITASGHFFLDKITIKENWK